MMKCAGLIMKRMLNSIMSPSRSAIKKKKTIRDKRSAIAVARLCSKYAGDDRNTCLSSYNTKYFGKQLYC